MKRTFTLLALSFSFIFTYGQKAEITDSISVSIDWEDHFNKNHKYKDIYSQKDENYIKWIYKISKNVTSYTADKSNTHKYYHDGRGNDPIAFTIKDKGEIRTEIYKNAVKPSKKKKSRFLLNFPSFQMPKIEGSLQKGVTTYYSDSSKGIEIGIEMDIDFRSVKIEILDLDKNLVYIIEDKILEEGWNHYKWDTKSTKSGKYILRFAVDEKEMLQTIEIEKHNGSLINRLFGWFL